MAESFEETALWVKTLAARANDPHHAEREALRTAYLGFRKQVALLVAQIPLDLRDYTVHDITHLDALWEMVSISAGNDYELTPIEGFVLGGAILLHDAGMSLAAYPDGLAGIRRERTWPDAIAAAIQSIKGRRPTKAEIMMPEEHIERAAAGELLRNLHAVHAERLALLRWADRPGDVEHYLLENSDLRMSLGTLIGKIAHSHWWSVSALSEKLGPPTGAPSGYPLEWGCHPLKVACLLRIADAMHLDSRRAPAFLRALRKPQSGSKEHWIFQEKLHKPRLDTNRLAYTSGSPFEIRDMQSWWLCFETLQMVDRELREVNAFLTDHGYQRLKAIGVTGADDPSRMRMQLPTVGWEPINARIKIGDVVSVVERLGGDQLYGNDPTVALRELIQNAADAIRARRTIDRLAADFGAVMVRLGSDEHGEWIEVEDNGIGMSERVLTDTLLDFGASYWGSTTMRQEWPGLMASGFEATGKYGIGFFSVFMWGNRVRVITRTLTDSRKDTRVLEFLSGAAGRPVYRPAREDEWISDAGTRVRVWPQVALDSDDGLLRVYQPKTFEYLCAWLCPALDVDLYVQRVPHEATRVVRANDWITLPPEELVERTRNNLGWRWGQTMRYETEWTPAVGEILRLLYRDGQIVGRLALYKERASNLAHGVVCVGGLRAGLATGVFGVLLGTPTTAARDAAVPLVPIDDLCRWSQEQVALVPAAFSDPELQAQCAELVLLFGGDPIGLPLVRYANGWLTLRDIGPWASKQDEIRIVTADGIWMMLEDRPYDDRPFSLHSSVLILPQRSAEVVSVGRFQLWPSDTWDAAGPVVLNEIIKAWGVMPDSFQDLDNEDAVVGELDGRAMTYKRVTVLKRARAYEHSHPSPK